MNQSACFYDFFETPVGKAGVVWSFTGKPKILKIYLPEKNLARLVQSEFPDAGRPALCEAGQVQKEILLWFRGTDWKFSSSRLDRDRCYEFQKKVLAETAAVRRGRVITYGRLAGKIGDAGAARAVGTALGRNPFPLVIPCHRVVRADGSLGGFGGGLPMKRKLLEMEGIAFDSRGRVKPDYICG